MLMIKKFAIIFIAASVAAISCKKNNTGCGYSFFNATASDSEVVALRDSLNAHGIHSFSTDPSGLFYTINNAGSGDTAVSPCSQITVTYTGKLLNGTTVDSTAANETATITLGQVIEGWQKAIPMIGEGGEIMAYVPPTLAYGSQTVKDAGGNVVIPPNSILIFDIKVLLVKNPG
jgi:FKBP-type peptidyl-prolyl cis-trans isomerase